VSAPPKSDKKAFFAGLHGAITGLAALATASVAIIGLSINQGWIGGTKTGGANSSVSTTVAAVPQYAVDPMSLSLQPLGATTVTVDVSNVGAVPMTVEPPSLAGPNASHFVAANRTCGAPVSPGGSCQLQVSIKQGAGGGTFNALLVVRVLGAGSATEVPITGTAIL
jgi:hypothetical protein